MDFARNIIANTNSNIRVYFIKKSRGKGGDHSAAIFPNAINDSIKSSYCNNFNSFTNGKEIREYDGVHQETDTIQSIPTSDLNEWTRIVAAIDIAERDDVLIDKNNFNDDYSLIVITFEMADGDTIKKVYLVAKYRKTDVWYKKSVKYAFVGETLQEVGKEIYVLNGCIDAVISVENTYILMPNNFESIFNYYKKSEESIEENRTSIEGWSFLDDPTKFLNCVKGKKGATLKMARVLQKSLATLNSLTPQAVMTVYTEFNDIQYDEEDKIVVTEKNRDLIIDILLNVYAKNIFNDELVHTKGA